jgi:hypothetical protein
LTVCRDLQGNTSHKTDTGRSVVEMRGTIVNLDYLMFTVAMPTCQLHGAACPWGGFPPKLSSHGIILPQTFMLCTAVLLMPPLLRICREIGTPLYGSPLTSAWAYWSLRLIFELFCVLFLSILPFHFPLQWCVTVCYCQCYFFWLFLQFECCVYSVVSSITCWSSAYVLTVIQHSDVAVICMASLNHSVFQKALFIM